MVTGVREMGIDRLERSEHRDLRSASECGDASGEWNVDRRVPAVSIGRNKKYAHHARFQNDSALRRLLSQQQEYLAK